MDFRLGSAVRHPGIHAYYGNRIEYHAAIEFLQLQTPGEILNHKGFFGAARLDFDTRSIDIAIKPLAHSRFFLFVPFGSVRREEEIAVPPCVTSEPMALWSETVNRRHVEIRRVYIAPWYNKTM